MSDRQNTSSSKQTARSSTPEAERSDSDTSSLEGGVYFCICGDPDTSRTWIHCDSEDCPVGWHHWQCVGVTEKPSGEWFCPRCSLRSTEDAELPERRGAKKLVFPKAGKTAATGIKGTLNRGRKRGQVVTDKGHVRVKKGIAIKKTPPKKKSKWTGWVETSSEGEDGQKESVEAARKAVTFAEGRRTKAHNRQSKVRLTRPQLLKRTSKPAAGSKGKARTEPTEEE